MVPSAMSRLKWLIGTIVGQVKYLRIVERVKKCKPAYVTLNASRVILELLPCVTKIVRVDTRSYRVNSRARAIFSTGSPRNLMVAVLVDRQNVVQRERNTLPDYAILYRRRDIGASQPIAGNAVEPLVIVQKNQKVAVQAVVIMIRRNQSH